MQFRFIGQFNFRSLNRWHLMLWSRKYLLKNKYTDLSLIIAIKVCIEFVRVL